jgi:hypothetical protein
MKCSFTYTIPSYPDPEKLGVKRRDAKYRLTPELQEVQVLESSEWHHDNGSLPSYEQYHFQAKKGGTLLTKESQKMDDLLNILSLSDFQMNNQTLRAHLKLVNPTRSYLTAGKLKCAKKAGWGILMENGTKQGRPDGIAHLTTFLGSLMRVDNIHLMSDWPSSHPINIQIGVPSSARHMVIHRCHVYAMNANPRFIVAAIQFLEEGGDALRGFEYVPMTREEILKAIHGHLSSSLFRRDSIHQCIQSRLQQKMMI